MEMKNNLKEDFDISPWTICSVKEQKCQLIRFAGLSDTKKTYRKPFIFLSLTLSLPKQYSGDVVQIGEHVMVSGHLYLGNGYNAVTKLLGIFFVLNI